MAVLECKMCGGKLILVEGQNIAECENCGTRQTVPTADNEKKLLQFERAGWLRRNFEFDKAAGLYEAIVSEYRRESEAYWGLVLCKYGIEYVDDPATGKKIPTCHRSSYDSIMEDDNFIQACEYADVVARKLYREEAKRIEEIRKGILEVSEKEAPYDIFICYKETDENGDRTLDSVLAQDLYTALTDKGYRVFFSRVTLKGELGTAYEPQIFAALNSAKVMLAVGTDYEYFNAVWVKNEWSRYLQICAKDKTKHLIPCYKSLDAYDMPPEFKPLQAVDLGQMGAVQDILFNMEKYIPLKKQSVIQEKVVVGTVGGNNKVTALLERGNMALEDGDWAKADSFFEDVLNNDAKNAQAYIGKTLAQEKCRTMDALVRKRQDVYQRVSSEVLEIPERSAYISGVVEKFALPGYLEADYLRTLYDVDRTYDSEVSGRKQQYQDESNWWSNHKLLSRAEKFASGSVAETLQQEKKRLFAQLNDRVKQAEQADAKTVAEMEKEYDAFLAETDAQAEKLYRDALVRREKDYQAWLERAKKENDPLELQNLANHFIGLGDYQDSRNLAEHCKKRADEEQDKLDEAEAQRRIQAEQKRKAQQAKTKKLAIIATGVIAAAVVIALLVTKVIIPSNNYRKAEALLSGGQYEEAIAAFEALEGYKDSGVRISEIHYTQAEELLERGEIEKAIAEFNALGQYNDSKERVQKIYYDMGEKFVASGDNVHAAMAFGAAEDYLDAWERSSSYWNDIAQREVLGSGFDNAVALREDGTVVCVGEIDDEMREASSWESLIAISDSSGSPAGLKADGTVVNISEWKQIVAISSGYGHVMGLKADGTVSVTGYQMTGYANVIGLWSDIIAISAGYDHDVALKSDGTVVAAGNNSEGQCNVSKWRNIVAVSAGDEITFGLKSDGTVVSTGSADLSKWENIVAVSAGSSHALGLKADGTVVSVAIGYYSSDEDPFDVSEWKEIVAVHIGRDYALGLKSDGTAVKTGCFLNKKVSKNVSGWKNIKQPAQLDYQINIKVNLDNNRIYTYQQAMAAIEEGNVITAYKLLSDIRGYGDSAEKLTSIKASYLNALKNVECGDSIFYGAYEQDKTLDGYEEIEWIVLEKDGSSLYLLSRMALEMKMINKPKAAFEDYRWSGCTLQKWLNGSFMEEAFTEVEQSQIKSISLLSIDEARKYLPDLKCQATKYANSKGTGNVSWWLRTGGIWGAHSVGSDGKIDMDGSNVSYEFGVRPVIWIDLGD